MEEWTLYSYTHKENNKLHAHVFWRFILEDSQQLEDPDCCLVWSLFTDVHLLLKDN